jgi:hypothetical protein
MTPENLKCWDKAKTEYDNAISQYRHFMSIRRTDMAFVTTVQAAVLTIVKPNLLKLDESSFFLTLLVFLLLFVGANSERRISAYMQGYMNRAKQIERDHGMSLLHQASEEVKNVKFVFSNRKAFLLYYAAFILVWLVIWGINLVV